MNINKKLRGIGYGLAFGLLALATLLAMATPAMAQQSVGIGTTTPDGKAALDITSTTRGVLFPRLTTAQQATLASILTAAEKGMMVTDATTGKIVEWSGAAWTPEAPSAPLTAKLPLTVTTNNVKINAGTNAGDLLTWDGTNWVNTQPAAQLFSVSTDNHQPYLVANYAISMFGIFPSQSDASQPYIGEIILLGCNFAPVGWHFCDGSLQPISQDEALFNLIGTTYGGDGQTTFALPDLRSRVAVHQGSNGTTNYIIGQSGGVETKTFTRTH